MKLLLIEDDPAMQLTLSRSFERRGWQVQTCGDGLKAVDRWQASLPDVVVLDLSLPGRDGLDVLQVARSQGLHTPVLILTARGTVGDRILGLNRGADDYLPKPFDLDELDARVQALARRANQQGERSINPQSTREFCGLAVANDSGAIYHHGQVLDLPPREALLLRALLSKPGHAVAKERLLEQVFADDPEVQAEAIEVVVYRLRKRLASTDAQLVTLRGLGYLLKASA